MEIGGVEVVDLPEGWTALEAAAVFKCLNAEGDVGYVLRVSPDLQEMEAAGMLLAAARSQEAVTDARWRNDAGDDEDEDDD